MHLKKLLVFALAASCAVGTAVPAMAANDCSITISSTVAGHTYEAYQIFSGTVNSDGTILSDIEWGSNVSATGQGALGKAADKAAKLDTGDAITDEAAAQAFADEVAAYLEGDPAASDSTLEDGKYELTGLAPGYYLIRDKAGSLDDSKGEAYTDFIMRIAGTVNNVQAKDVRPTLEKYISEDAGASGTYEDPTGDGWDEASADHQMYKSFQFALEATIPDGDLSAYDSYKVAFHDTMAEGLTFEDIAGVYVDGKLLEDYTITGDGGFDGKAEKDGAFNWTLTIDDLKATGLLDTGKDHKVTVFYNAHINDATVETYENKSYLEYSNNPNFDGEGDTGTTVEDQAWALTFKMENEKVGKKGLLGAETPLGDAHFRLLDADGNEIGMVYDTELNAYRPVDADNPADVAGDIVSAEDTGAFNFYGLAEGTYKLHETQAPDGYNQLTEDIVITISVSVDDSTEEAAPVVTVTYSGADGASGSGGNKVINYAGTLLPSTGGAGTTALYAIGICIVACAAGILVYRRKKSGPVA